ncbi:MAG: hypothetical protein AAGC97_16780 [Planctomycetota bacterium]
MSALRATILGISFTLEDCSTKSHSRVHSIASETVTGKPTRIALQNTLECAARAKRFDQSIDYQKKEEPSPDVDGQAKAHALIKNEWSGER